MKKDIQSTELTIAKLLKAGVLLSAAIIFTGLALYLITGVSGYENNVYPTNLILIISGVLSLKSYAIMMTGLLILILTPIFRVGVSIIVFAKEKDKLYIIITASVFIILIISLILGKVE
jgi:uncharacterized membrane protein